MSWISEDQDINWTASGDDVNRTLGDVDMNGTIRDHTSSFIVGRVNAAVVLLFLIIGLPWNTVVIGIILKKKLFTKPSGLLLLNLAISNFLVCLIFMPVHIVLGILVKGFTPEEFTVFENACQVFVMQILLIISSIFIVALMSVDRVIYLMKPMTYEHIVTPWRMFCAIVAVWLYCTMLALFPLVGFGRVGYVPSLVTCSIYSRFKIMYQAYFLLVVGSGALGSLVQLAGCGGIIYITRDTLLKKFRNTLGVKRPRNRQINRQTSRTSEANQGGILKDYTKSQLQLVKVFGAIITVSLLTIIPFVIFGISVPIIGSGMSVVTTVLHPISYLSMISRSVIHPILEAYMTHETRQVISRFWRACVRRCWGTGESIASIGFQNSIRSDGGFQSSIRSTSGKEETGIGFKSSIRSTNGRGETVVGFKNGVQSYNGAQNNGNEQEVNSDTLDIKIDDEEVKNGT